MKQLEITKKVRVEKWRAIANYEGLYEVSNLGRVKSLPHTTEFKYKNSLKTGFYNGRVLKKVLTTKKTNSQVVLSKNGKKSSKLVISLVTNAFLNPDNDSKITGRRKNNDPFNDSIDNIRLIIKN